MTGKYSTGSTKLGVPGGDPSAGGIDDNAHPKCCAGSDMSAFC
nr:hypothetical protein [Corynebacterium provencense]